MSFRGASTEANLEPMNTGSDNFIRTFAENEATVCVHGFRVQR